MIEFITISIYVFLSVFTGFFASSQNRGQTLWGTLAVLITPAAAFVLLLILEPNRPLTIAERQRYRDAWGARALAEREGVMAKKHTEQSTPELDDGGGSSTADSYRQVWTKL